MTGPDLDEFWTDGDVEQVKVFKALVAVLQSDPVLSTAGISWRVWDGTPGEYEPPAERQLPWIRLTPVRTTLSLKEVDNLGSEFRVKFEIAVRGTNWANLGNLAGYFQRALRYNRPYGDTTVLNALRAAGATSYDFESSGSTAFRLETPVSQPSDPPPPATVDLVSAGTICFKIFQSALD